MPHQATTQMTQKALHTLLKDRGAPALPPGGAKLVTIRMNQANDNLVLVWEHESFPESEGIQKIPWMELPKVK